MPHRKDRPVPSAIPTAEALGPFKFYQLRDGHRLTTDSVLLAGFVQPLACGIKVADLGAGTGAVSLLLAASEPSARFACFEIDRGVAALARRNVAENGLEGRVEVVEGDMRATREGFPEGSFGLVVSNPPYVKAGAGRVSPVPARATARCERMCTLPELVETAARLAGKEGRAAFVYPARRLDEMLRELGDRGLKPLRLRFVYTSKGEKGKEAKLFLVEAGRRGALKVEGPVFL